VNVEMYCVSFALLYKETLLFIFSGERNELSDR
jgi:hypothetical protein